MSASEMLQTGSEQRLACCGDGHCSSALGSLATLVADLLQTAAPQLQPASLKMGHKLQATCSVLHTNTAHILQLPWFQMLQAVAGGSLVGSSLINKHGHRTIIMASQGQPASSHFGLRALRHASQAPGMFEHYSYYINTQYQNKKT